MNGNENEIAILVKNELCEGQTMKMKIKEWKVAMSYGQKKRND